MSTIPFFEADQLIARFRQALTNALDQERISEVEAARFEAIVSDERPPAPLSVELVLMGHPLSGSTLLITYQNPQQPWAYVFSPLTGLQVHESRAASVIALHAPVRHLGVASEVLAFLTLETAVFEQWSRRLVAAQIGRLKQTANLRDQLPTLPGVMQACLTSSLQTRLPEGFPAYSNRVLLIDSKTKKVAASSTLNNVALKVLARESQAFGYEWQYLDSAGRPLPEAQSQALVACIAAAVDGLPGIFAQLLDAWWSHQADGHDRDRHGELTVVIADNFARALLIAHQTGVLSTARFEWFCRALFPGAEPAPQLCQLGYDRVENGRYVTYAGLLVIRDPVADDEAPVYVYAAESGIRRFRNEAALKSFFLEVAAQPERPVGISALHWTRLQVSQTTVVEVTPVAVHPLRALTTTLQDLLKDNVTQALRQPGAQAGSAVAAVEEALDIGRLIDPRLVAFDNAGRWPRHMLGGQQPQVPLQATTLPSRIRQLRAIALRAQALSSYRPSLDDCIDSLLAPSLALIGDGQLRTGDIRLRHDGVITPLADWFIKRVTHVGPAQLVVGVDLLDAKGEILTWPDPDWLLEQVDEHVDNFAHHYKMHQADFEIGSIRSAQGVLDIREETEHLYEALLRADLAEARYSKRIDTALLDALEQRLNHVQSTEVTQYSLFLRLASDDSRVAISNTFALSLSSQLHSPIVQWTPLSGLVAFASQEAMRQAIDRTLVSAVDLRDWATLMAASATDRLLGESVSAPNRSEAVTVQFEVASGPLVAGLCQSERIRRSQQGTHDLAIAIRCRFDPVLLRRFVAAHEAPLMVALRESSYTLLNQRFNMQLPKWLNEASAADLRVYQSLLDRCAQMAAPDLSYLFGIPEMVAYARDRLKVALAADDPDYPDDPDQISITLTHFTGGLSAAGEIPSSIPGATSAVTRTLTEFALTHFSEFSSAVMTVEVKVPDKKLPQPRYLRDLVTRLDVATPYRQILADKLDRSHPDYRQRRRLFAMGMQPNLLACAYQARLEEQLSRDASHLVATVVTSPDGVARQPVDGRQVQFGQLHLQAGDFPPDPVSGMYVIGPGGASQGPLVLYTAYQDDHILLEFKDEADLLHHLHSDERLESLVVQNVSDAVRVRYANKGLLEPHIIESSADLFGYSPAPAPARLVRPEITGNMLHYLYDQNIETLLSRATAQTVTKSEARWKAWRELLRLGIEEATVLIPSRLALLVNLWQSFEWLQASAQSTKKRNWGQALAEFTTALATLALSRDPRAETAVDRPANGPNTADIARPGPGPEVPKNVAAPLADSTQHARQRFEARDVALAQMLLDPVRRTFSLPDDSRTYAPVEGHVYEVRKIHDAWYIVNAEQRGPRLRIRGDGQWEFHLGLKGGADHGIELESEAIERSLPQIFTVQAEGMAQIYQYHYGHYLQIQNARTLVLHLLGTALSNLNAWRPWDPLPAQVRSLLENTFGEPPSNQVLSRLRDDCKTLLKEFLSPSLSPESSNRLVSGYNKPGRDYHLAFTYRGDPKKRVFLSELFFTIPDDVRMNSLARDSDLLAHHQAVTLIHEMSHLTLKTEDITYVDAIVPSLEVLERETPSNLAFYNRIKDAWEKGFTAATPAEQLFTFDDGAGPRDLRAKDNPAKAAVLRLTGRSTLEEARADFHNDPHKRANLILSNADSLALLISRLGQQTLMGLD